uniref:RxLR effector candidate protein n=1 Tax=Hyaloperonospora arabidopsidis (strain Emoy2) TaxID=559515 RepID=M4BGV9_HYAAE
MHDEQQDSVEERESVKTSKESGDRPPYPGWEVPYREAQIKGGGLRAAACATGGSAACKPKGEQQPRHPEVRGTATAVAPPPSTYYSTSAFELSARSPSLTPEPHEANLPRT